MSSTSLRGGTTKQSPVITEHPILFQTEMVRAILDLRKTQTRRDRNLDYVNDREYLKTITRVEMGYSVTGEYGLLIYRNGDQYNHTFIKSPFGKPGDLLWVRESWNTYSEFVSKPDYSVMGISDFVYRADDNRIDKWKPSIHMPKDAARIWLMIEDIRVERVQEISKEDAEAEGAKPELLISPNIIGQSFKLGFFYLWASINGEESLNQNPWVWVIQFRVLSTTGRPSDEVIQANYKEVRNG